MNPEAAEAIRIADKFLAGESVERRKALALAIHSAILQHAEKIAADVIAEAVASTRPPAGSAT